MGHTFPGPTKARNAALVADSHVPVVSRRKFGSTQCLVLGTGPARRELMAATTSAMRAYFGEVILDECELFQQLGLFP
jgi:hypothetical protein